MEKIKNIIIYACDEKKTYAIAINEDDKRKIITDSLELRKTVFALYGNVVGKSTSDFREAVKHLLNSKHLLVSNDNVIVEIHYNKEDDITKNVEVKRLDGTKTVITADQDDFEEKLKNVINEVTTTYGSKEALTDLNIFTFENVTSTKQATVENESTQEENETEEAEEEQNFDEEEIEEAVERRNPGVKKFKIFKRGLALAVAVALGFGAHYLLKKDNETKYIYVNPDAITTPNPVENPEDYTTQYPDFPDEELPTPTEEPSFNFDYTPITEKNSFLVKLIHDSGMEETTYMEVSYNDICFYASNSANEIMNYIAYPEENGKPSVGICVAYSYSIDDPKEKSYVSYIENIRNTLVASYFAGDMSEYNKYSRRGCVVIMAGLGDDKLISKDGYTVCYSDLSPETKDVTTKIFKDILDMSQNTTFEYDGKTYGFYDAQDIVYSRIDELEDVKIK